MIDQLEAEAATTVKKIPAAGRDLIPRCGEIRLQCNNSSISATSLVSAGLSFGPYIIIISDLFYLYFFIQYKKYFFHK